MKNMLRGKTYSNWGLPHEYHHEYSDARQERTLPKMTTLFAPVMKEGEKPVRFLLGFTNMEIDLSN